jgi:hypothetical protein
MLRTGLLWIFLLLGIDHACSAQVRDSAFWSQHSWSRPDSVLAKDTALFSNDTIYSRYIYTDSGKHSRWADSGAILYETGEGSKTTSIVLRGDHSFILQSHGERGMLAGSIGRWWLVSDSLICLNWFDTLTFQTSRHSFIDYRHKKIGPAQYISKPVRVDHWWFVRRCKQLVPYIKL